jgi:hemerythrin-like domain-containing protein
MPRNNSERNERKSKGLVERLVETVTGEPEMRDQEQDDAPLATKLLKDQHDEVRRLFKEYEGSGEGAHATRKKLIAEAGRKLDVHAQLEERIFYPACRSLEDEKARKMVGESLEEHLIVKRLIKELEGLTGSDEKFESKAVVLKESVEHHADEEESDLFPAAESELDDERLRDLGREMKALKTRLESGKESGRMSGREAGRKTARTPGRRAGGRA